MHKNPITRSAVVELDGNLQRTAVSADVKYLPTLHSGYNLLSYRKGAMKTKEKQ
jgi:uncharacterized protein YhdP